MGIESKTSFWEGVMNVVDSLFDIKLGAELKSLKDAIMGGGKKVENANVSSKNPSNSYHEAHTSVKNIDVKKPMSQYSPEESRGLFESVFGTGMATQLLFHVTKNSPIAMQRVLALASHEGAFHFGIRNADPNKASGQVNYSTFQLSAKDLPAKILEAKNGAKKLIAGTPLASMNIDTAYT
jgi:hypothetical protein